MSYPFSICKQVIINCSDVNITLSKLIKVFETELGKLNETVTEVGENEIKLKECAQFSSRGLRLKNLNKGKITFEKTNEIIVIKSKIILIEHIILFTIIMVFIGFGILNNDILKVALILALATFVFCYLFPLITLNSFVNETIRKFSVQNKEIGNISK